MGFSHESGRPLLDIVWAHPKVRLVANALGPAPDFLVTEAHERGILVAGLVGTVVHAERQQAAGVDLDHRPGLRGRRAHRRDRHDGARPAGRRRRGARRRCSPPAASPTAGRSPPPWRSAPQGVWCGSVWLTTEEAETHPS